MGCLPSSGFGYSRWLDIFLSLTSSDDGVESKLLLTCIFLPCTQIKLESLSINFERMPIGVLHFYRSMRKDLFYQEWSWPSRFQFTRKEFQPGVEKQHLVTLMELFWVANLWIMKSLGLLLINPHAFVSSLSPLMKFIQLELALSACSIQIHV